MTAGAAVRSVAARWTTPEGAAAPPAVTLNAGPYRFRRQVGGPMTDAPQRAAGEG